MSRSSDYWLKCGEDLEKMPDSRCRVSAKEISGLYDGALESIQKHINQIYGRFVKGYGLTPQQAQQLLTQEQTREVREELQRLLDQTTDPMLQQALRARLDAPAYAYRISKLEALRDEVYFDAAQIAEAETHYHESRLVDLYRENYYRTSFDLSREIGYNVPFEKLSNRSAAEAIRRYWTTDPERLGANFSQRVWGNTTQLAEDMREIVTRGLMTGQTYSEMIEELTARIGSAEFHKAIAADGSTRTVLTGSGAKYRAARLIRTEGNYISGQARMASYRDAGIDRYTYHSLLELKTCKVCGGLDGKDFPVSEQQVGVNMHPMHPHCRCFTGPYRSAEELQGLQRAAQTGVTNWQPVPQGMTYQEWRKKYVDSSPDMLQAEKQQWKRKSTAPAASSKRNSTPEKPRKIVPVKYTDYLAARSKLRSS